MNSICRKVCEYEEDRDTQRTDEAPNVCRGCGRTAQEIEEWYYATRERKVEIAKTARARTKAKREADRQR